MTNHGFMWINGGTLLKGLGDMAKAVSEVPGVVTAHVVTPSCIIAYFETGTGTFVALRDLVDNILKIPDVHITQLWIGLHSYAKGEPIHPGEHASE